MSERITPCHDLILLKPLGQSPYATGGLKLPQGAKLPLPHRARVLATGPGVYDHNGQLVPLPCSADDVILYHEAGGIEVDREGRILLSASAVLAVLPDGAGDAEGGSTAEGPTSTILTS